jgi:hypothetical protein
MHNRLDVWQKRMEVLVSLGLVSIRYVLYRLSSRRLCSRHVHQFSQLLAIAPGLRRLCGMTTVSERAYLQWFTQVIFKNEGAIVDLGCWLGSTTIPLARGLARNKRISPPLQSIYAYDAFVWRSWMAPCVAATPLHGKYRDGDSFVDEFKERTAPWQDRIRLREGDLATIDWKEGKIEFLLIDIMKSWELANSVISRFFPALIPGRSLVLHQDFAHWYTPWIHLIHYRLRHHFCLEYDIPRSTSVVFRLQEPIPPALLACNYAFDSFRTEEIHAAFDYSSGLVSSEKRENVAAAKIMCFVHSGDLVQASRELDDCRSRAISFSSDLCIVEERVRTRLAVAARVS